MINNFMARLVVQRGYWSMMTAFTAQCDFSAQTEPAVWYMGQVQNFRECSFPACTLNEFIYSVCVAVFMYAYVCLFVYN